MKMKSSSGSVRRLVKWVDRLLTPNSALCRDLDEFRRLHRLALESSPSDQRIHDSVGEVAGALLRLVDRAQVSRSEMLIEPHSTQLPLDLKATRPAG